jgi:hypothetical protein
MTQTQRLCPHCKGIVSPVKRGGDPDATLATHIEQMHGKPKEPKEMKVVKL